MGLWSYFRERGDYKNEVTRARHALVEILDLSYKVAHTCPEDVEDKLAIRCIGFDAVNDPTPTLPKLRETFANIGSRADDIVGRKPLFQGDFAAVQIVETCVKYMEGHSFPSRKG